MCSITYVHSCVNRETQLLYVQGNCNKQQPNRRAVHAEQEHRMSSPLLFITNYIHTTIFIPFSFWKGEGGRGSERDGDKEEWKSFIPTTTFTVSWVVVCGGAVQIGRHMVGGKSLPNNLIKLKMARSNQVSPYQGKIIHRKKLQSCSFDDNWSALVAATTVNTFLLAADFNQVK